MRVGVERRQAMVLVKRIVCLANSRKLSGRCIAGKEIVDHRPVGWVRPVSSRAHQEVSEYERQYPDGSDPRVLDVMDVPLLEHEPRDYQQENWLLDPKSNWAKAGRIEVGLLPRLRDPVAPLWHDGHHTANGLNDKIPLTHCADVRSSLRLVHVPSLTLAVFSPGAAFGNPKRRVQASFDHAGVHYQLWVTDPAYERHYLGRSDGTYDLASSFLTISLGEPYQGDVYKLVATIIPD